VANRALRCLSCGKYMVSPLFIVFLGTLAMAQLRRAERSHFCRGDTCPYLCAALRELKADPAQCAANCAGRQRPQDPRRRESDPNGGDHNLAVQRWDPSTAAGLGGAPVAAGHEACEGLTRRQSLGHPWASDRGCRARCDAADADEKRGAFTAAIWIDDLDASVLLLCRAYLAHRCSHRGDLDPHCSAAFELRCGHLPYRGRRCGTERHLPFYKISRAGILGERRHGLAAADGR
jgi:hypothetical protein